MQQQILKQSAEYNELVEGIFSKVEFSSFRNSPHLLWMRRGAMNLKESIDNLLGKVSLTDKEKKFLVEIKEIIDSHLQSNIIIIEKNKSKKILYLSIDAIVERDNIIKGSILDEDNYKEFKEALFLLEANSRLLELVKNKIKRMEVIKEDFFYVREVSKSLIKTYLFLSGKIEKEFLFDSMKDIQNIWRHYHPLPEILVK